MTERNDDPPAIDPERLGGILAFVQAAERLKDTLRSGVTAEGRRESVAEHSWRLCLFVTLFSRELAGIDELRLVKLCLVHDLGEAIAGDVPAPLQHAGPERAESERAALAELCAPLPADLREEILALAAEYAAGATPEAVLAKGFDKLETILQHALGKNPPDFDYAFNLAYGAEATARHPLLRELRVFADAATRGQMAGQAGPADKGGRPET
ncbi:HD domain-containing protein [Afifella pfennigii]|uniref:HD domain-containing protein n=1 Tax=Afifella pfennigii TaxID=209897 RepID=UPI00069074D7|nr:HD domain-containing protein [Afifella pfennigii]